MSLWICSNGSPLIPGEPTESVAATCAKYEVLYDTHCYYLDGSGGHCASGYKRASNKVLASVAPHFKGKTYKKTICDNCCVWTSDSVENYGMDSTNCCLAGEFRAGPVEGGSLCTQVQQHYPAQLTFCVGNKTIHEE